MTKFAITRKTALSNWKVRSNRVFKVTDNFSGSIECEWQSNAWEKGYNHISIFCSIGQFASHITDLLRDYRYDRYEFDQSEDVNEILFRYYTRVLLIASEVLTDFQDLFIIADNKLTTKQMGGTKGSDLKKLQDQARKSLAMDSNKVTLLLDFINKVCKHKTSNLHICNNHIKYLFEDFHRNIKQKKKRVEIGNINSFTSYDLDTFEKFIRAEHIVVPSLTHIIDVIIEGYKVIDALFRSDNSKFEFICKHYDDK
ncbi:MAG: hypothetical protein EOP04_02420 [Proteobacteria bacterium]|nr:MAG: hypothetical protein EOP04_02420 [Pseudomonadota bacterium]